jgi:hypothetical protein
MLKHIIAMATALAFAGAALAEPVEAGTVKTVKGQVSIERGAQKIAAAPGVKVHAADRVLTGADGSIGITLRDNTVLSAGPNSTLALDKFAFDSTTHAGTIDATLKRGTLSVVSGKIAKASPDAVTFRTPTTTLGVRGTEFVIEAADRGE